MLRWGPFGASALALLATGAAFVRHWNAGGHAAPWAVPLLLLSAATLLAAGHAFARLPQVALGLASLCAAIGGTEVVVRATGVVPSAGTEDLFRFDPKLGWRLRPGARAVVSSRGEYWNEVHINADGWRDPPEPDDTAESRPVVAVLGDSFVTNLGVRDEEVFTQRLDRELPEISVRNFGVNGYGQVQELLLLDELAVRSKLALALVVVYVRNDFDDNTGEFDWIRGYDRPRSRVDETGRLRIASDVLQAPAVRRSFGQRVHGFALYKLAQRLVFTLGTPSLSELAPEARPPELRYCRAMLDPREADALRATLAVLERMHADASERGIDLAIVIAPTRWQVDDEAWDALLQGFALDGAAYRRDAPQQLITSWCRDAGIACHDLLPGLERRQRDGEALYHPREQHWTVAGNAAVAQSLLSWLRESGLAARLRGGQTASALARR
jgi:hypothetical protein